MLSDKGAAQFGRQRMSEPDTRLENWCRRLVEAYATHHHHQQAPRGSDRPAAAKGPKVATEKSTGERAKGEGAVASAAGYASATELPSQIAADDGGAPPSQELLQLIDAIHSPMEEKEKERGATASSVQGASLVPLALPRAMKTNIFRVTRQEFSELYAVESAVLRVESGSITSCQLLSMYLKSFRNVLTYDLLELREHDTYYKRFVGYCTYVLHDLVEALFPDGNYLNIVSHQLYVAEAMLV